MAEYDHEEGKAVVGGFVYRGSEINALKDRYVFGDFLDPADGRGRLFQLATPNSRPGGLRHSDIREPVVDGLNCTSLRVPGFGQDAAGELYVLTNETGVPFGDTERSTGSPSIADPVVCRAAARQSPATQFGSLGGGMLIFRGAAGDPKIG